MRLQVGEVWSQFKELLRSDSHIRNRFLATFILFLLIIVLFAFSIQQGLPNADSLNSRLIFFLAINVNIVLLAIVFYLTIRNLLKLAYERRQGVFGVNLKTKLVIAFITLSLPAMAFHLFASGFIAYTLESWLAGQQKFLLQNASKISEVYHKDLRDSMLLRGQIWRKHFQEHPDVLDFLKQDLRKVAEAKESTLAPLSWISPLKVLNVPQKHSIVIYDAEHKVLRKELLPAAVRLWHPLSRIEWKQFENQVALWLTEELDQHFMYRYLRKVTLNNTTLILEVFHPAPPNLTKSINRIAEQKTDTLLLSQSKELIRNYYMVIFLLMTFAIIFVATWLAFYFARGFVRPIEELSLATQRVAEGELGFQAEPKGTLDKDFALLVDAFNAMSSNLERHQKALEKTTLDLQQSNQALEENILFVGLVLENINTGVISLNMQGNIEGMNHSAKELLQVNIVDYQGQYYRDILEGDALEDFESMFQEMTQEDKRSISRNVTILQQEIPLHIDMSLLILKNREGGAVGMVAVYNNITQIQKLQRAQAWREVARRIAHEIKNPLTPIQLSAERIRRKYGKKIKDPEALMQATQTIINEVEQLKNMVNEFSNFAKVPESNLQIENLHDIILDAVQLYQDNLPSRITLNTEFGENIPPLSLDREQMKRVFVNLLDNAITSINAKGEFSLTAPLKGVKELFQHNEVLIQTSFDPILRMVLIEVSDTGTGVSAEVLDRLFEPYATTKKEGTGLGLSIVNQTISDHNGFIRYQQRETGGSTFVIELPVS